MSSHGSTNSYPTEWSQWRWSEDNRRYSRFRLNGPEDCEWEYNTGGPEYIGTRSGEPNCAYFAQIQPHLPTGQSLKRRWKDHTTLESSGALRREFDRDYKVHPSRDFKWGRIFKVLWAGPQGAGPVYTGDGEIESSSYINGPWGQGIFTEVRRFVIISSMPGHCICLPIVTYRGQGVNKNGVHAAHHAIIYSGKSLVAFKGEREKGLVLTSIRVKTENHRHRLDNASRLVYTKTFTVEHNVKVSFIGKVHRESEWQLMSDYNRVHPPLRIKGVITSSNLKCLTYEESEVDFTEIDAYVPALRNGDSNNGHGNSRSSYQGRSIPSISPEPLSSGGSYRTDSGSFLMTGSGYPSTYPANTTSNPLDETAKGFWYGSSYEPRGILDEESWQRQDTNLHFGANGDPGDDLRMPGDWDNNGNQRDGDEAGVKWW